MGVYQQVCRINGTGKLPPTWYQQKIFFWKSFKRNTFELVQGCKWWCLKECASSCFRVLFCAFLVAGQSGWMSGMSELKVLPVLASRSPNFGCSDGLLKHVSCICPRTSFLFCLKYDSHRRPQIFSRMFILFIPIWWYVSFSKLTCFLFVSVLSKVCYGVSWVESLGAA